MNDLVCQNELMESTLCQCDFLSTLGWSPIHSQTYAQPALPPDPIHKYTRFDVCLYFSKALHWLCLS